MGNGEPCRHAWEVATRDGDIVTILCPSCGAGREVAVQPDGTEARVLGEQRKQSAKLEAERRLRAESNPSPSFVIVSSVDDVATDEGADEWLIDRILPYDAFVLVIAQTEIGKTTAGQNVGMALLRESDFLGFAVPTPYLRRVLYVNLDESAKIFRRDMRKLGAHERFLVMHADANSLDIQNEAHMAELRDRCRADDIGVVFIDVLSTVFSGDENVAASVNPALNALKRLKAEASLDALLLMHHSGWAEAERARGSTAIPGQADVIWTLQRRQGDGARMFSARKRIEPVAPVEVVLDWDTWRVTAGGADVEGSKTYERNRERAAERDAARASAVDVLRSKIAERVTATPGISKFQLRKYVGGGKDTYEQARRELIDEGVIRTEDGPRSAVLHYLAT